MRTLAHALILVLSPPWTHLGHTGKRLQPLALLILTSDYIVGHVKYVNTFWWVSRQPVGSLDRC